MLILTPRANVNEPRFPESACTFRGPSAETEPWPPSLREAGSGSTLSGTLASATSGRGAEDASARRVKKRGSSSLSVKTTVNTRLYFLAEVVGGYNCSSLMPQWREVEAAILLRRAIYTRLYTEGIGLEIRTGAKR